MGDPVSPGQRLEQYSLKHPQELLRVEARVNGQPELVMVFKGFSSSLMGATDYNPDVPVLPPEAEILSLDRLQSPYQPDDPQYLAQGMSWAEFEVILQSLGL
jgi:hypothetical protein